jgi:Retroviral aspartyl protease
VRLTIGTVTKSGQIAHAEIQLGDFKSWSSFRVLEWDAYDIILGMDWLRYWKAIWNRERSKLSLSNGLDKRQSTFILFSPFISCLGAVGRIRPSPFAFLALGPLLNALHPQLAVWGCEEKVIWDTVSLELLLNLAFFDESFAVELHAVPLVLQEVRLCT